MKIEILDRMVIDAETGVDLFNLDCIKELGMEFVEAVIREVILERDKMEDEILSLEQKIADKDDFIDMIADNGGLV